METIAGCWSHDIVTLQLVWALLMRKCNNTTTFFQTETLLKSHYRIFYGGKVFPDVSSYHSSIFLLTGRFSTILKQIFEYQENSGVSMILKVLFLSILNGKRNRKSMQTNFLAKGRIPFEWHWSYDTVPLQVCDLVIIFIIVFTDGDPIAGQFWESSGNPGLSRWIIIIPFQSVA